MFYDSVKCIYENSMICIIHSQNMKKKQIKIAIN